jgi:Rrf2 family protein
MKLIRRDTDYAIRALCVIARHKDAVIPVSAIIGELGIRRPFLRKILQMLNKKKILRSHKGKGGGFSLAVPPEDISVGGLMGIFQGPFELSECNLNRRSCPRKRFCALRKKIDVMGDSVFSDLEAISIKSLIR